MGAVERKASKLGGRPGPSSRPGGEYFLEVGESVTRLVYLRPVEPGRQPSRAVADPEHRKVDPQFFQRYMSAEAAQAMRATMAALPLQMLGDRPLFIDLTLPNIWRRWVPDIRTWEAKRDALLKRWERRYGRLMGMWVREYQLSGRPHMHWYVACPEMSEAEYRGLVERTLLCRDLERQFGKEGGRAAAPTIGFQKKGRYKGLDFGGEFAWFVRSAWSEVVTDGTDGVHLARGVDVRTSYFSDAVARAVDKRRVLEYMATEMGKAAQKVVPFGFCPNGARHRWWGLFGRDLGFKPSFQRVAVAPEVGAALAHEMEGWVRDRMRAQYADPEELARKLAWRDRRREEEGVTALGLYGEERSRVLERAELRAVHSRLDAQDAPRGHPVGEH